MQLVSNVVQEGFCKLEGNHCKGRKMDDVQKVGYSGPFSSITSPSPPSSPPSTFTSIWFVWTHVDLKQLLPLRGEVE